MCLRRGNREILRNELVYEFTGEQQRAAEAVEQRRAAEAAAVESAQ